ncbi:helix-turn-helix domain-containing protein [Devosia sp.]|uniref:helix-turn-helix domain-containing protein n=1 Tax=Devosia sp. TaxID=1871048 RepID=UPI001ACE2530|nr:helix-turn-helix domain-containing protein [Devosia sp.]MBN9335069.1 hypothetical protein [Devosia sp.]
MSYAAQLRHHYADVRKRLVGSRIAPPPALALLPLPESPPEPAEPVIVPIAVERVIQTPTVIAARVGGVMHQSEDLLPLPDAEKWKEIIAEVCRKHGIDWLDMASIRRTKGTAEARHEAMYRMRHETTMSLPAIGRKLGGRDHSTVMYGIRKHAERMGYAQ